MAMGWTKETSFYMIVSICRAVSWVLVGSQRRVFESVSGRINGSVNANMHRSIEAQSDKQINLYSLVLTTFMNLALV